MSRGGIFRLNLDRDISQWMPTHDISDFRTISNLDLHAKTNSESIKTAIKRHRLRWFGHVLRIALYRISQAKRKQGRLKAPWRKKVEKEIKAMGLKSIIRELTVK